MKGIPLILCTISVFVLLLLGASWIVGEMTEILEIEAASSPFRGFW